MPVARLRLRITSHWVGGTGGDDDTNRLGRPLRTLGQRATNLGSRIGRLVAGPFRMRDLLLLTPAMFTLGKHLVALAGGVTALAVVVGAAAAPWIGLAITAAMHADEMGAAGARYQAATSRVGDAWMSLARRTAPETLGPLTDVLNGMANAIPKLEPLVRQIGPDFARMGRDIRDWLSGQGFERAIQNLRDYGVPAFRNLVAAGKDFLATTGIGFRAFLPIARDVADTIQRQVARWRQGAQGGGFQRFLRSIREEGPTVRRFLDQAAEFFGKVVGVADRLGGPGLAALSTMLRLFNMIDPEDLIAIIAGIATGSAIKGLLQVAAGLASIRAANRLTLTGLALTNAARLLSIPAPAIHAWAIAIRQMARNVRATLTRSLDTSALDRIRNIWNSVPKNTRATLNLSSVNLMMVAIMGLNSTWVTVQYRLSEAATFSARVDLSLFAGVMAVVLAFWGGVLAMSRVPAVFTAVAINTALGAMTVIIGQWTRVRSLAATPAVFRVTASPGNVASVASTIVAAWARVRAAAASVPVFTAIATPGNVPAGAAAIIAAWMRVRAMPKSWQAIAIVNPGGAVSGSSAVVSAWRGVLALPRSWSAVAIVVVNGGFGGLYVTVKDVEMKGGVFNLPGLSGISGAFNRMFGYGTSPFPDISLNVGRPPGGSISNPNPGDFSGGFGQKDGGPAGRKPPSGNFRFRGHSSSGEREIHIHDDVWIRNRQDLVDLLDRAIGG